MAQNLGKQTGNQYTYWKHMCLQKMYIHYISNTHKKIKDLLTLDDGHI